MKNYIVVKIFRPEEGYQDVHAELVLEDFTLNPKAWQVELVEQEESIGYDCE